MKRITSEVFSMFAVMSVLLVTMAHSNKGIQLHQAKQSAVSAQSEDKLEGVSSPGSSILESSSLGYRLITDILDGWGGESKSTQYEIPISSGGQASVAGIWESNHYRAKTGFILAIDITRGDVNEDRVIDVGDIVYLINYLYRAGVGPTPLEAGDGNCDGMIDVGDVVYLVNYLYKQGPPPCY